MPPKLSKRQQRELDELEALGANKPHEIPSGEELGDDLVTQSSSAATQYAKVATFAQLMVVEESEEESEQGAAKSSSGKRKPKKRKKKSANADAANEAESSRGPARKAGTATPPTASWKSEKRALKKAKAKEKKAALDELDQALAELSIKYPEAHKSSMSSADSQSFSKLLSVSLAHLDSEAELRRFFGAKVIQANKTSSGSGDASAGAGGRRRQQGGGLRSNLTKPKPTWWAARQREGLSIRAYGQEEVREKMERLGLEEVGEEKWWTVEYSKKYKSMTRAFMRTVMSGDPQGFWNLLGKLPWHADTLLQVAEIYRHREEWAQAVDFIDRALYTYERSFIGAFNFTSGQNRLDFDRVENRPFFLAIHRQITDLHRRGCVRTAFEFARLLYSLDPWTDPHGALFHLDLLALKAPGMGQWLLDVYDVFASRRRYRGKGKDGGDARMDPSVLPGWAYSRALAMWMAEDAKKDTDHKASSDALKEAVMSFPAVVLLLAGKIDAEVPNSIRTHKDFDIKMDGSYLSLADSMFHMLSHLYAQHASGVWKEPAHTTWFSSVLASLSSTLPSTLPITPQRADFVHLYERSPNLRYSAYRHVLVLESSYRRLFSFIPKGVTESRSLACDPLPPPNAITQYDNEFFEGVEDTFGPGAFGVGAGRTRRQREADQRRLAQLVGDEALLRQVQEMFEGNPGLAERFPGGILQFAQMVDQLPEDVVEELMVQVQMGMAAEQGGQGEGVGMPGGFGEEVAAVVAAQGRQDVEELEGGDEEEDEEDDDDDEDEDEDEASPILIRGLRNIIGRFWGGNAGALGDESTSESEVGVEEDEGPVDDGGVD
ncbi:hypothetical protein AX17_007523 [Amanita inopinata Kibby_2008]|nr:hypothetical protein AX17_007523 [Amanita inopinata Kibby_2008]